MTIVELITGKSSGEFRRLAMTATATGTANALLLGLLRGASDGGAELFALFLATLAVYALCARALSYRTTVLVEDALHAIKVRLVGKIARAELAAMDGVGVAEIHDRITENITLISTTAGYIVSLLQSGVIAACVAVYVAWVSFPSFVVLVLLVGVVGGLYRLRMSEVHTQLRRIQGQRVKYFDGLTDLLYGFKEVKYSRPREQELREDIDRHAEVLSGVTVGVNNLFNDNWVFTNCGLYVALAFLTLGLPQQASEGDALVTLVACLLFLWGPLSAIAMASPAYARANFALSAIAELEERLDVAVRAATTASTNEDPAREAFSTLELWGAEYSYPGGRFHVGPVDLTIHAGEIVFFVGGNGSGKSTLLKLLTGLYSPTAGVVVVDGEPLDASNVAGYRELFTTVFADFHLFSELYGLHDVDEAEVARLLAAMQLTGKTDFDGRGFTRRTLSTGQRKRLAMIVSLLEDRPIFVLDEWAADQDPQFREHFYRTLLPDLRRRGKTVIAVSHDDRYFDCADRVVTMEYGRVRQISPDT